MEWHCYTGSHICNHIQLDKNENKYESENNNKEYNSKNEGKGVVPWMTSVPSIVGRHSLDVHRPIGINVNVDVTSYMFAPE